MTVLSRGGAIAAAPPLSDMSVEELLSLWDQMLRNRDHATVVKVVHEEIDVESDSEARLVALYKELKSRGRDPLLS